MISVTEALERVLALANTPQGEIVSLDQAAGRVLHEAAISRLTQPPFDSAAMDGYAYRHADLGRSLRVIGESAAGHPWTGTPGPDTAIRIFTGAAVPPGYDRVEMQENTRRDGDNLTITKPSANAYIRSRGGDFNEGDRIEPGRILTAADIALLAGMNLPQVSVAKRPKVAVLAGGDELVRPGENPAAGQIICSNDLAVAAIARAAGAEAEILPIARDTTASLRESFDRARTADLLITIGGASVGDHDLIGKITAELGMERSFYKIAMRPGKPLIAGKISRMAMLGLPGNPVSAIVCAIVFMRPLIQTMQGLQVQKTVYRARLSAGLPPEGERQHYLRAQLLPGDDLPGIAAFAQQDSSLLSVLSNADALLIRSPHDPARQAGEIVEYIPLIY